MTHAPELRSALIRCCIFVTFGSALWALMPLVARHELGMNARGYGILVGFFGTGALSGLTLPKMRKRMSMDTLLTVATVSFAMVTFALAYLRVFSTLLYLTMIAGGVAWVTVMSSLNVAAQTSAASWVQSRALGFFVLAFQGLMGVSSVLWGAIANSVVIHYRFSRRDRASLRASRGFSMAVERDQGFGFETIFTLV